MPELLGNAAISPPILCDALSQAKLAGRFPQRRLINLAESGEGMHQVGQHFQGDLVPPGRCGSIGLPSFVQGQGMADRATWWAVDTRRRTSAA